MSARFDVRSKDGTPLAVWELGGGDKSVVLVHGSLTDHTTFEPLAGALQEHIATFAMDRRGYGASGDAPGYTIEREFEDVAAVVDAVAARNGRPVSLWGHSYGANCAMGAACLTSNVERLVLYEPSLGLRYAPGSIEAIEGALAAGNRDAAVRAVLIGILEMAADDVVALAPTPRWPVLLAGAHLVAREARVEHGWVHRSGQFDRISAPTLLLLGGKTPDALHTATHDAAAAIPNAEIRVLDGQAHLAYKSDPELIAGILRDFI